MSPLVFTMLLSLVVGVMGWAVINVLLAWITNLAIADGLTQLARYAHLVRLALGYAVVPLTFIVMQGPLKPRVMRLYVKVFPDAE